MERPTDLKYQVFGRWFVHCESFQSKKHWVCECFCGTIKRVRHYSLVYGVSNSCGCLSRENNARAKTTHGKCRSALYAVWSSMKQRCTNPKNADYGLYGGRGITVTPRWHSFEAFERDMGKRPSEKHSLDRINNDLGYSKENCRWATINEQAHNKRSSVRYAYRGQKVSLLELSELTGIPKSALRSRLKKMDVETAISKPCRYKTKGWGRTDVR